MGSAGDRQGEGATSSDALEEDGFRGLQVCKLVGITYRQLDYWARTDLIRPSLADAAGSGTQRRYSYRDLVALKVVKSLLDSGVSLRSVRKAIDYFRDELGKDLATASLVIDGSNSVIARSGDDLVDLVRQGQGVLNIVRLGSMVEELDAQILELAAEERGAKAPATGERAPRRAAQGS